MYILDTNVIIYFLDNSLSPSVMQYLNKIVDDKPNISIITKMEALGFNFKISTEQYVMESFINGSNTIDINDEVVRKTIEIRKRRKSICLTQ